MNFNYDNAYNFPFPNDRSELWRRVPNKGLGLVLGLGVDFIHF